MSRVKLLLTVLLKQSKNDRVDIQNIYNRTETKDASQFRFLFSSYRLFAPPAAHSHAADLDLISLRLCALTLQGSTIRGPRLFSWISDTKSRSRSESVLRRAEKQPNPEESCPGKETHTLDLSVLQHC